MFYKFYNATIKAPPNISIPPKAVFQVKASPKNKAAKTRAKTTDVLSIATTLDTGPYFMARKYKSHDNAPATPDKIIKSKGLPVIDSKFENLLRENATAIKNKAITTDLIVVANVESTPFSPILPKIATKAAKTAEPRE